MSGRSCHQPSEEMNEARRFYLRFADVKLLLRSHCWRGRIFNVVFLIGREYFRVDGRTSRATEDSSIQPCTELRQ